jgi:predicted O-methyltransferase YrrM
MENSNNFEQISNFIKVLSKNKENNKFWNITDLQCYFLREFISLYKPKNILELGTSNGFSSICMCGRYNNFESFDTIEINKERLEIAKRNFNNLNLNINTINLNIYDFLEETTKRYDFIFIDSQQSEYLKILKLIIEKKIINDKKFRIIFDNVETHKSKEMIKFLEYVEENFKYEKIEINNGFLLIYSFK